MAAPGALWRGSTTGLWVGGIAGALLSGLATRQSQEQKAQLEQKLTEAVSLCANDLELTPAQREVINRFLVLLMAKLASSSEIEKLSQDELQRLVAAAKNLNYQLKR